MIGPRPARVMIPFISGGLLYPNVTNALLWLDRNRNVFSDTAGTTPASVGGTIGSWRSVGEAWGTALATQSTAADRPTLRSDGVEVGNNWMSLGSALTLTGDFTIYYVLQKNFFYNSAPIFSDDGSGPGKYSSITDSYTGGVSRLAVSRTDGAATSSIPSWSFGKSIKRIRRSGSTVYFQEPGSEEQSMSRDGTITLTRLFSTSGTSTDLRFCQLVVVGSNITPDSADDVAIRNRLLALEPDATDCKLNILPTVSSSTFWYSRRYGVCSDTGGATPVALTGTIGSWKPMSGWAGSGNLSQATAGLRPTWEEGGIKTDGTDDNMDLPSAELLSGDWTIYTIFSRTLNSQSLQWASDGTSSLLGVYLSQDFYYFSFATGTLADGYVPLGIRRYRKSGSTGYLKIPGSAEQSHAITGNMNWSKILGRSGESTNAAARLRQLVFVRKAVTHGDADDLAIRAALKVLEYEAADI